MADTTTTIATTLAETTQWPYRMTYDLYERIEQAEVIRNEEHVILLDGILIQTGPKTPQYCTACHRAWEVLQAIRPDGWMVRPGQPVVLRNGPRGDSVPEPEVCLVRGTRGQYEKRHPTGADIGLVVRIVTSNATFEVEREGLFRYADAHIPTVWIITLYDRKIHIHTEPSGPSANPGYGRVEVKHGGDSLLATLTPQTRDQAPAVLGPLTVASFFPSTP